jgi:hypothetical protein
MTRSAYVIAPRQTVVFWSRKAGNTSLSDWLLHGDVSSEGSARRGRRRLKSQDVLVEPDAALALIREQGFEHFVLARNPYRRAVSMFTAQFISNKGVIRDELATLSRFGRNAFLEIMATRGQPAGIADYPGKIPGISFIELLSLLKRKILARESNGEPDLNAHFNTQVPFLFENQLDYTNIMRLERVAEDILPLAARLGIDVSFPSENKNATRPEIGKRGEHARSLSTDFIREGQVPTRDSLLDDEAMALIREAFEIDFRKLNYDPANAP